VPQRTDPTAELGGVPAVTEARMRSALDRLEAALDAIGSPVVRALRPGISEDEVVERFHALQLEPPTEVKAWYGWHDGYEAAHGADGFGEIACGTRPFSLTQACDFLPVLLANLSSVAPDQDSGWFPLGWCQDKRVLIVYCGANPNQFGHVTVTETELPDNRFWATTLAQPVEWWAEYLEDGTYYYAPPFGMGVFSVADIPDERRFSGLVC
jgi:hypothetical protein